MALRAPFSLLRVNIELFRDLVQALGWEVCLLAPVVVLFGYVIFGMVGFGATITNAPLLAHLLPLRFVVPLTLLLDMFAAIYLSRRIADISAFRATMAKLVLTLGLVRFALFVASGLIGQAHLLLAALLLAPFAAFGLFLGNRLHHGLSARRILVFVYLLLIVNGAVLVVRAW